MNHLRVGEHNVCMTLERESTLSDAEPSEICFHAIALQLLLNRLQEMFFCMLEQRKEYGEMIINGSENCY